MHVGGLGPGREAGGPSAEGPEETWVRGLIYILIMTVTVRVYKITNLR